MVNQPNFIPFPTLQTPRLALRQLRPSDAPYIFAYQADKANFPHVDMAIYTDPQQASDYIVKMNDGVAQNKWIVWAIADRATDAIIGTISIWMINLAEAKAELGYGLFPDGRGKGYMQEALLAVTQYGLSDMGLKLLEAYTAASNLPSINLLERAGFTKIGDHLETETLSGDPLPMVIYGYRVH